MSEEAEGIDIEGLMEAILGDTGLAEFRFNAAEMLGKAHDAKDRVKMHYTSVVMSLASNCLAQELVWHLEDHDGTECALNGLTHMTRAFNVAVRSRVELITKEKGLKNPFTETDVNSTTTQEILDTIERVEAQANKKDC